VHFAALPALLFDLERDPDEFVNVAAEPAYAQTVLGYAQKLLSWRQVHEDQTLTHQMASEKGLIGRTAPRF
jgi:hypothetical protein